MAGINVIDIWIDGACSGNPGPGGWAYLMKFKTGNGMVEKMDSAAIRDTTNNQMEVAALEQALLALKYSCYVTIHTDSMDLIGWMTEGWKRKNPTLKIWLGRIDDLVKKEGHALVLKKVEAHSGELNNDRVDHEACRQRDIAKSL
jgi:ribonuclease HI